MAFSLATVVVLIIAVASIAFGLSDQRQPESELQPAIYTSRVPVGACAEVLYISIVEPDVSGAAATGWIAANAAYRGSLSAAAEAFGGRVVQPGETIAWIERQSGFAQLTRIDKGGAPIWVVTRTISPVDCPPGA